MSRLPTIKNSILWDNSSSDNLQISQFDTLANPNVENCIVQGGVEYGTRIVDASPELLSLADNGGYIQTCALSGGSVAIAKCTTADSFPSTDARCFTRNTTACLGAYEYLPIATTANWLEHYDELVGAHRKAPWKYKKKRSFATMY